MEAARRARGTPASSFGDAYPTRIPIGVRQKNSSYLVPRLELRVNAFSACALVISSLTGPIRVPFALPVAPGQRVTWGTGTFTAALVAEWPEPATFEAVTVHVSELPSSIACTLYVALVAPEIGVPFRFH